MATSAGTTGLHAALTAVGVKPGDLVIIPSFTFIATANAVAHCGAIPWVMDVSARDWCLDPAVVRAELERGTERRVAALMPVYTLGNIPDMDEFRAIADEFDIPLVVDAACAIGATYRREDEVSSTGDAGASPDGKAVDSGDISFGGLADLSVISFNGNKTVTCGGGGAVVGDDEVLLERVKHLTTTARLAPEYDFDMVGFNYRMTNLQAAVGCAQMENLDRFVEKKRAVHRYYEERLAGMMWNGKEISFFPVTESVWERVVTLPCGTGITDEELETVVEVMRRWFDMFEKKSDI